MHISSLPGGSAPLSPLAHPSHVTGQRNSARRLPRSIHCRGLRREEGHQAKVLRPKQCRGCRDTRLQELTQSQYAGIIGIASAPLDKVKVWPVAAAARDREKRSPPAGRRHRISGAQGGAGRQRRRRARGDLTRARKDVSYSRRRTAPRPLQGQCEHTTGWTYVSQSHVIRFPNLCT